VSTTLNERRLDPAPVAILGAGPVGLALANELAWRGVRCVLIDRRTEPLRFPTSESIHARTMEHFRRWGIADAVRYAGFPPELPRNVSFVTRLTGYDLGRVERPSNRQQQIVSRSISPEGAIWCPKFLFEEVMRRRLRDAGTVEILAGCELDAFEQDAEGVELFVRDLATGHAFSRRALYLAACDGASSSTRKSLGIKLEGKFAEGRNLGIFLRSAELGEMMRARDSVMADIINPDFSANLSAVDGDELWRLIIFARDGDPDTLDPETCIQRAAGRKTDAVIVESRVWAGHTVVAESFQRGRVFLAGDAAHLLWPRGGFGMNTGVGDAVDLGWKLDAVLKGWGGSELLTSYEAERRPVAVRNVAEAAENYRAESSLPISTHLDENSTRGEAERARMSRAILETRTREWSTIGLQLGYVYEGSPICWADGTIAPRAPNGVYLANTRPGARAPHAWLDPETSYLDRFGRGFCLVHRRGIEVAAFDRAAAALEIPLSTLDHETITQEALYERALVLVRPDGHVAWRGNEMPEDVEAVLGKAVGRVCRECEHLAREAPVRSSLGRS